MSKQLLWLIGTIGLVLSSLLFVPLAQAQGGLPDLGPGPDKGGGGDGNDGGDNSGSDHSGEDSEVILPTVPEAIVSGYVYNGGLAPQPGVTVILSGGGWQTTTVSDSNGYYEFKGLGTGKGYLSLAVPPNAQEITPQWPVFLSSGKRAVVNLGYHYPESSPLPVLLSAQLTGNILAVRVENRVAEPATGGLIEVLLPAVVTSDKAAIQASRNAVTQRGNHYRLETGVLNQGEVVTLNLPLTEPPPLAPEEMDNIRVIFTYDQQFLPQAITFNPAQVIVIETAAPTVGEERQAEEAVAPAAVSSPSSPGADSTADVGGGGDVAPASPPATEPEAATLPTTGESEPEATPPTVAERSAPPAESSAGQPMIPTTGGVPAPAPVPFGLMLLPALVGLALIGVGWKALQER